MDWRCVTATFSSDMFRPASLLLHLHSSPVHLKVASSESDFNPAAAARF